MSKQTDICIESSLPVVLANGLNTNKNVDFTGAATIALSAGTTINGSSLTALGTITSSSAQAFAVGLNGLTNPAFNIDSSVGSQAAGLNVAGATAAGTVAVAVISSGVAASLTIDALGTGTIGIGTISTGAISLGAATGVTGAFKVTSASATSLTVGRLGATTPAFSVDSSTGTQVAGLKVTGAASGGTVAVVTTDSGSNTSLTIDGKGTGTIKINSVSTTSGAVTIGNSTAMGGIIANGAIIENHATAAINSTGTATAANVATGYITSTSASGTTITLPTGTLLGAALGATQGTIFDLTIDNTAGSSTVTIAVATNGILSAAAAAGSGAGAGLLTVPSGVTGQGVFRLMFSSSTAYTFSRIA